MWDIVRVIRNCDEDSTVGGSNEFTSSEVRTNQSMNKNTIKNGLIALSVSLLKQIFQF